MLTTAITFQIFLKDGQLSMLVGKSTNPSFGENLAVVLRGEQETHSSEYTLYKEGKSKSGTNQTRKYWSLIG